LGLLGGSGGSLAEEQDRLAALAQAAELRGQGAERVEGDAAAQFHPVALRQLCFLDHALDGKGLATAAFEVADAREQFGFRPRVLQVAQALERLHHDHEVVGPEQVDEAGNGLAQRQRDLRPLVDVVVVQEDAEQPDIVSRRFLDGVLA
jgi:hypothetical protein